MIALPVMICLKTLNSSIRTVYFIFLFTSISFQWIAVNSLAQNKSDSTQYKITSWGSDDGIPNRLISLYQDQQEYLWIGSFDGLFRFDGTRFTNYNRFNTPGLGSDHVKSFVGDRNGNLWIGTGKGLVVCNKGKFTNLAGKNDFFIESIKLDERNNKLWIGTRHNGLYEYDIGKRVYTKVKEFENELINAIALDASGGVWVGSEKNGLTYFKNAALTRYGKPNGLLSSEVLSLYIDSSDQLYVCTSSGLFQKKKTQENFTSTSIVEGVRVESAKKDRDGNLWMATAVGAFKQNSDNSWTHLTTKNGLSTNEISDVCFIPEGSIWLATSRGGLNQLREAKFITISTNQGLTIDGTGAIQEISKNKFLVGSTNGKLFTIEHRLAKPFPIQTKLTQRIHTILRDAKNNLWIGNYDGLLVITPTGLEKLFTEKDGLPTRQIRIIYQDKKNNYWIGTRNKGLIKMTVDKSVLNPKFKIFKYDELNQMNSTFIMSIEENDKNEFLIGSNTGGLLKLSADNSFIHYSKENGLDVTNTLSARYDKNGIIWIASSEGLMMMEDNKFFSWTPRDGLPVSNIFDVMEDSQGFLWMPSAKGIIRVEKQQLLDYKTKKIHSIDWKIYTSNNELENSDCTGPSQILKASDGSLWFSMTGGVVVVDTKLLNPNNRQPNVYIEKVTVDEKEFNGSGKLTVSAGKQRVVFSYAALCLHYPNSAKYKYQLQPFDKDWIDAGTDRQAVYTSLPGGDYVFNVIACNNDGVWNATGASLLVVKQPYFYQTWWFYVSVFALLGLSIIAYIRLSISASHAKAMRLEREVERRTRQLKQKSEALEDRNREKTGMINIVAHDLKAPLNKIKGLMGLIKMTSTFSEEQQEYVSYIDRSISQGDQLIRDLLDIHSFEHENSKLELAEVDLVKTLTEWQQSISGQLHQKNQTLDSRIDLKEGFTISTDPHKLIRVLDNLVTNASKFSERGKTIHLKVWQNGESIMFSFRDEGPGISEADQKKLFKRFQKLTARPTAGENSSGLGLSIIKVLLEKLGGTISVNSKLGEGTEFIVSLPTSK
jgi:signal transduction histidine kinase/ligand-binding sensor domain-containing protein